MAEATVTIEGNLTADPELRYTQSGKPAANFTVAVTPRYRDRATNEWVEGTTLFLRSTVWGDLAEHVAGSLKKGAAVIVRGTLRNADWETKEGEKRRDIEVQVQDIGPSLRFATAEVTRIRRESGPEPTLPPGEDAWATGAPALVGAGAAADGKPF
jgi:single-strand DNA-binding protein